MQWNKNTSIVYFYKSVMPFVYNIGAAVVILGAMFKVLNLPGGNIMLGIGLSTEALIFFLSAFESQEEVDWSRDPETLPLHHSRAVVTHHNGKPITTVTQPLDSGLQQVSLDNLITAMRHFSESVASMPSFVNLGEVTQTYITKLVEATQMIANITQASDKATHILQLFTHFEEKYAHCLGKTEEIADGLTAINGRYKDALTHIQTQATQASHFHSHVETALHAMEEIGQEAVHFKQELAQLNEKVAALNQIYAKTLTAFRS